MVLSVTRCPKISPQVLGSLLNRGTELLQLLVESRAQCLRLRHRYRGPRIFRHDFDHAESIVQKGGRI